MLKGVELNKSIEKEEYKNIIKELSLKLGELQRKAKEANIPTILVFEGWDASGKGTIMNKVLQALDPRGYKVYSTKVPNENERFHPFLWRFWINTPIDGGMVFFDRSWYRTVTIEAIKNDYDMEHINNAFEDIINFEKQMSDNGTIILKFFLHISKKEQMKRFRKLQEDPATRWRVTKEDIESHHYYHDYIELYDEMILRTNKKDAPWVIVEANDKRYGTVKIFKAIIEALEKALKDRQSIKEDKAEAVITILSEGKSSNATKGILGNVDLSPEINDIEEYKTRLKQCQRRLRELEHEIYTRRISVIAVYEGWDAAGKGGNIKRLVENLDPRGYEVIPVGPPNDDEKAHHYLWRFWRNVPKDGHIAIFDRSWYGRVLVERIEGYCSAEEWKRAYKEINDMEAHLAKHGSIIGKFWLQIDKEEQLKRFRERENIALKNWKITSEDWRNREKWDAYQDAANEMLNKTNTCYAPWNIIESNNKYYSRIKVYETLIKLIEAKLYK